MLPLAQPHAVVGFIGRVRYTPTQCHVVRHTHHIRLDMFPRLSDLTLLVCCDLTQ